MSLRNRKPTATAMSPLFEVKSSADKGQGMFVTQDILVGTIILEERPTMIISNNNPTEADVHRAFMALSEADQDLFNSLHEGTREFRTRLSRIYHENCFDKENRGFCFICLQISKINHSCMPNAVLNGTQDMSSEELIATQHIQKGDEIFICYRMDICESSTLPQRQNSLLDAWHFQCRCPACSKAGYERKLSDTRRMLIHTLRWKTKFLEPFPIQSLTWLDPQAVASAARLTDDNIEATRTYYDRQTTAYHFILTGLIQAEGLPAQRAAESWHEAAESLLDELNCVNENIILLGAAGNVRAWMIKAIELTGEDMREGQAENWETMRRSSQLDIALAFSSLLGEGEACSRAFDASELAAIKRSDEQGLPDSKTFALRFFHVPGWTAWDEMH